jgi:alcohol dehydrogenase, propanol-preferring
MWAAVLEHGGPITAAPLQWREVATPEPGPGEVRVRVKCCAICRTDLHVIEEELPPTHRPLIPGHQVVGIVEKLGTGCTQLALGQRVGIAWLRRTCGTCVFCRRGQENLCPASRYTGYHADGGFAEYAIVPAAFAYVLPDAFDDRTAAPLLCAGIIGYRAWQRAEAPGNGRLALYGFGSSAHIVLQLAAASGIEAYVVSRTERHLALARELGATWTGRHASDLPVLVDSAILFAPAGELVPAILEKLAPGGTLALAGIYMTDVPALQYERHLFHERNIRSVTANTRADGRALLAAAAALALRPHVMTYPMADANRALQDLKSDRIAGTGVLVP